MRLDDERIRSTVRLVPSTTRRQTHLWDGFLPEDVRHQIKLRVSYDNKGFNAGPFFGYASGAPLSRQTFQFTDAGYLNLRSPTGNLFNLRPGTSVEQIDIPTFGQVTTRQQPFRFQLALRYVY